MTSAELSLTIAVESLMNGADLTLTSIGRSLAKEIKPKSKIKEVDYFLSNGHLHRANTNI